MRRKLFILATILLMHTLLNAEKFKCPVSDCSQIYSDFGTKYIEDIKKYKVHTGIDILLPVGTPVYASSNGKVVKASTINGYGTRVKIQHKNGLETIYAHLSKMTVKKNQIVKQGDLIGYSGNSGSSYGPHLHFGMYKDSRMVDPKKYIINQ